MGILELQNETNIFIAAVQRFKSDQKRYGLRFPDPYGLRTLEKWKTKF